MYGLINSSLQCMIREKFGDERWEEVLDTSGVPKDSFLSMRSYEDAITYDLMGAASEVLEEAPEACMEMFGEYWVLETANKDYGQLMDAAGQDMIQFLRNLNALHDRITGTFVNYVPPEFKVESLGNGRHRIHYVSKREGLTPFVVGLLKGLAIRFNVELEIHSQEPVAVAAGEHTVFEVTVTC